jgi:hypothetical protein
MTDARGLPGGLVALMERLIDYAGLFPPAGLGMAEAAACFDRHLAGPDAWALGRFVVPLTRLSDLEQVRSEAASRPGSGRPWSLTVLADRPVREDVSRIAAFNAEHAGGSSAWPARIDSVETRASAASEIAEAAACVPAGITVFFEVPFDGPIDDLCRAAASAGHGVKLRTGGTAVDAFPPVPDVARALGACAAAGVPFKATAGLHHPVRSEHQVTYAPGAPAAIMHGFLNLFVAASLLLAGKASVAGAANVLEDGVASSFRFDDEGLAWRGRRLERAEIAAARRCARSFGSCSFDEPVTEVRAIAVP